jgi:hypothetical protein
VPRQLKLGAKHYPVFVVAASPPGLAFGFRSAAAPKDTPQCVNTRKRFSGFEVWTFEADGLIPNFQGRFDMADYQRQLEHGLDGP